MTVYYVHYIRNPYTRYAMKDTTRCRTLEEAQGQAWYHDGTIEKREEPEPSGSSK